ncbi:TIGR02281 family clan AA aspartic protease [Pseudomonadota bacterium]
MSRKPRTAFFISLLLSLYLLPSTADTIKEITLLALGKEKAIFRVDGKRHVMKIGDKTERGLTLVKVDSTSAIIDIDGVEETIKMGMVTNPYTKGEDQPESVTLWAGPSGFFHAEGGINGHAVKFLVDTGANTVAINSHLAEKIGLDLSKGYPAVAQTASGVARMVKMKLNTVSIGPITLHNVDAGIIMGRYPTEPLLGASFLGGLNMVREGSRLELIKR